MVQNGFFAVFMPQLPSLGIILKFFLKLHLFIGSLRSDFENLKIFFQSEWALGALKGGLKLKMCDICLAFPRVASKLQKKC